MTVLSGAYWLLYRGNYDLGKGCLTCAYLYSTDRADGVNKVDTEMGVRNYSGN